MLLRSAWSTSEKNSGEEKEFMHGGSLILVDPFPEIRSCLLAHNDRMIGFMAINIHSQFYPFKRFIAPDVLNIDDVLPVRPEKGMIIEESFEFRKVLLTHISSALLVEHIDNPAFSIKQDNIFHL